MLLPTASLLLISGILLKNEEALTQEFKLNGLSKKQILQKDGWIALLFEMQ